jgi:hypothetical protein
VRVAALIELFYLETEHEYQTHDSRPAVSFESLQKFLMKTLHVRRKRMSLTMLITFGK